MKALLNRIGRIFKFLYLRFLRMSGTIESISRGVAIGFFIGLLVPMGGQILVAIPVAHLLKAQKMPAIVFTWITNPYTVIFIYPIQCYIGSLVLMDPLNFENIKTIFSDFFNKCTNFPEELSWLGNLGQTYDALMQLGTHILIPFLLGGLILGTLFGILSYFTAYGILETHRRKRSNLLRQRLINTAHWKKQK